MLAVASNLAHDQHDTGPYHPERASRLRAAYDGLIEADLHDAIIAIPDRFATIEELARVHDPIYLDRLQQFCAAGGGDLDPDTCVVPGSWETALRAAGAGLATIEALQAREADAGLVLVRPPGHHALADSAMGFCLFNNVAVAAGMLRAAGEKVVIIDWDVHHGNGTQAIFYDNPNVLFVSAQLAGHWPFTGGLRETGGPMAPGMTINLPLPHGATGDVYLDAFDRVINPAVEELRPTWVLVSAGFDSHREDPLGGLGLSAGDFADFTRRVMELVPGPSRCVLFLEGGYNLDAVRVCTGAVGSALLGGTFRPERSTSGGPGEEVVRTARAMNLKSRMW